MTEENKNPSLINETCWMKSKQVQILALITGGNFSFSITEARDDLVLVTMCFRKDHYNELRNEVYRILEL